MVNILSTSVYICTKSAEHGGGCVPGSMSHAVDVYAFGVVLWEMYTAQRPWAGMRQAQIVHTVCSLGQQLEFPYGTPSRFEVSLCVTFCQAVLFVCPGHGTPSCETVQGSLNFAMHWIAKSAPQLMTSKVTLGQILPFQSNLL